MEYNAPAAVAPAAVAPAAVVLRNYHNYDLYLVETHEWNTSNEVRIRTTNRSEMINNTPNYHTGRTVHHLRSIQMNNREDWNALFGLNEEYLNPELRNYVNIAFQSLNDHTHRTPFAGQIEVSLLMERNYRPRTHLGVFIIHLTPHRKFKDGHMFQIEFGEGSAIHNTINRLFDTSSQAVVVSQAMEYDLLELLADDNETYDLLYGCFIQGFNPLRYSYVEPANPNENGHYVEDQMAMNEHWWFVPDEVLPVVNDNGNNGAEETYNIQPPPPQRDDNRFEQLYWVHYNNIIDDDENYIIENRERFHNVITHNNEYYAINIQPNNGDDDMMMMPSNG